MFGTVGWDVDVLEKSTDAKGAENLFREGLLKLVEMDVQVFPAASHLSLGKLSQAGYQTR